MSNVVLGFSMTHLNYSRFRNLLSVSISPYRAGFPLVLVRRMDMLELFFKRLDLSLLVRFVIEMLHFNHMTWLVPRAALIL